MVEMIEGLDIVEFRSRIAALEYHGTTAVFCEIDKIRIHGFICQVVNMRAIVLYVQAILLVVTMMPQYEKSVLQLLLSLRIRLVKRLFWITCLVSLSIQSILLIIITNVLIRFRTHILEK